MLPLGAIFEPSMSVGPEEDNVTSLNLAVAVSESSYSFQRFQLVTLSDSWSVLCIVPSWECSPTEP